MFLQASILYSSASLLEVFGFHAGGPGVVGFAEGGAAAGGGVVVGPEFEQGAGVGVVKGSLAVLVIGAGDLCGVLILLW